LWGNQEKEPDHATQVVLDKTGDEVDVAKADRAWRPRWAPSPRRRIQSGPEPRSALVIVLAALHLDEGFRDLEAFLIG